MAARKLSFVSSGWSKGGFRRGQVSVLAINTNEKVLAEYCFQPQDEERRHQMEMPAGAVKINWMLVGRGSLDIIVKDIRLSQERALIPLAEESYDYNGRADFADSRVTFRAANVRDPGFGLRFKSALSGALAFDHKGRVEGGRNGAYTVLFIDSAERVLKEVDLRPEPAKFSAVAPIEIPPGCVKINWQLVDDGRGKIELEVTNLRLIN